MEGAGMIEVGASHVDSMNARGEGVAVAATQARDVDETDRRARDIGKYGYYTVAASSPLEQRMVFATRHEAYLESYPDFSGPGSRDSYDDQPNCLSYVVYTREGAPVGSIRPCIHSSAFGFLPVPAFDLFQDEVERFIGSHNSIVQSTHFVMLPQARGAELLPKLLLFREVMRTAAEHGADYIMTIVKNSPALLRFYGRMGLSPIGAPKMHPVAKREGALIAARAEDMVSLLRVSSMFHPMVDY
jgi:hypothetical protein